jgi:hypothetical protein
MALAAKSAIRRNQLSVSRRSVEEIPSTPIKQRSSLSASVRQRTSAQPALTRNFQTPEQADVLDEEVLEPPRYIMTDDLIETPQGAKVPPRLSGRAKSYAQSGQQRFPSIRVIFALAALLIVVWAVTQGVLSLVSWGTDVTNTLSHGPTRLSVVSSVFGISNDSPAAPTSVIAINLDGKLVIESIPAGDVSKLKSYPTGITLVGDGAAKIPISLIITDENGDKRPDVRVEIPGQNIPLKLINNGTGFTPTK